MKNAMDMADGARRERAPIVIAAQECPIELVDIDRAQFLQMKLADIGRNVVFQQFGVSLECLGAYVACSPIALPALDEFGDG